MEDDVGAIEMVYEKILFDELVNKYITRHLIDNSVIQNGTNVKVGRAVYNEEEEKYEVLLLHDFTETIH